MKKVHFWNFARPSVTVLTSRRRCSVLLHTPIQRPARSIQDSVFRVFFFRLCGLRRACVDVGRSQAGGTGSSSSSSIAYSSGFTCVYNARATSVSAVSDCRATLCQNAAYTFHICLFGPSFWRCSGASSVFCACTSEEPKEPTSNRLERSFLREICIWFFFCIQYRNEPSSYATLIHMAHIALNTGSYQQQQ